MLVAVGLSQKLAKLTVQCRYIATCLSFSFNYVLVMFCVQDVLNLLTSTLINIPTVFNINYTRVFVSLTH